MQDKLDVFWHRVQRWVTNCFSSTPVPILAIESCLPPLVLLIEHRQRMATLRMVCSPPEINPASARLHKSVPNRSSYRSPFCHRSLLVKLNPAYRPLMWKTPQITIRKHLPIDEIAHRTLPLLKDSLFFPSHHRQLVPTLSIPPMDAPSDSYVALRKESRAILHRQWRSLAPPPPGSGARSLLLPQAILTHLRSRPTPSWASPSSWPVASIRCGLAKATSQPTLPGLIGTLPLSAPGAAPQLKPSSMPSSTARPVAALSRVSSRPSPRLTPPRPYGPPIMISPPFLDLLHSRPPVSRPTCSPRALLPVLPTALFPPRPSPPRPASHFLPWRMFDLFLGFFTLLFETEIERSVGFGCFFTSL